MSRARATWWQARRGALGALLLLALGGLQLVRPGAPVPTLPGDAPTSHYVDGPAQVETLLRAACYDCHSDETQWPWYSRISPLSWWIVGDVEHGLSNLDFSRWSNDPVLEPTPAQRLAWICRDLSRASGPPGREGFLMVHPVGPSW